VTGRTRLIAWVGILVVAAVSLAVGALDDPGPQTAQDRVRAIGSTIACPQCEGQSVSDSNATSAINIRAEIARQVEAGRTDDEIRTSIAASFGDEVLLVPARTGIAGLVWFLPVLVAVLALGALAAAFWRWREEPAARATDDDRALVERARNR
jgi:cytochrome c-type biogenesis protein CcmH